MSPSIPELFSQVNLDQNAGITSLLIGGFSRLDFYNGNALTVSGDANAAGGFLMHAGSATIVGTLTNSGTLHVSQEGFGASTLMAGSLVNTGVVQIGKLGDRDPHEPPYRRGTRIISHCRWQPQIRIW